MSKRMADFYSERLLNKANKPSISEYLFDEDLGRNKMSKFNVGDRFEIEIAEVFKGAESGNDKYRIKGFDNLVFDDKGLSKMQQTRQKAQYYKFIYTVEFKDGKWCNAHADYDVEVQGEEIDLVWHNILGIGATYLGATVVVGAKTLFEANKMLWEEIQNRNRYLFAKGECNE